MKREEWGGYRDKKTWIRSPLHREGKLKLRFLRVTLIICFYFFLLTVMIIEMWWCPKHLFYIIAASYSSPTPIRGSFSLLRTSLEISSSQQQNSTSFISPNSLVCCKIRGASIASLGSTFWAQLLYPGKYEESILNMRFDNLASFIRRSSRIFLHWNNCKYIPNFMPKLLLPSWLKWIYIYFLLYKDCTVQTTSLQHHLSHVFSLILWGCSFHVWNESKFVCAFLPYLAGEMGRGCALCVSDHLDLCQGLDEELTKSLPVRIKGEAGAGNSQQGTQSGWGPPWTDRSREIHKPWSSWRTSTTPISVGVTTRQGISNPGDSWKVLIITSFSKWERRQQGRVLCWTLFLTTRSWWGV